MLHRKLYLSVHVLNIFIFYKDSTLLKCFSRIRIKYLTFKFGMEVFNIVIKFHFDKNRTSFCNLVLPAKRN